MEPAEAELAKAEPVEMEPAKETRVCGETGVK